MSVPSVNGGGASAKTSKPSGGAESKKVKDLEEKNTSLKHNLDSVQQERDFYFAKLRDVEIICTDKSLESNRRWMAQKPACGSVSLQVILSL